MTLIASGEIGLQDAGTNPSTTVTNKLYDNTMASSADALLVFERLYELSVLLGMKIYWRTKSS